MPDRHSARNEATADGLEPRISDSPAVLGALRRIERIRRAHEASRASTNEAPQGDADFQALRLLGRGGQAEVRLVYNTRLERNEAHKFLSWSSLAASSERHEVLREARLIAGVDHSNIVRIYDAGEREDGLLLRLEYVEGQTLEQFLAERGPLPAHEAAEIGLQVTQALTSLHGNGLAHYDVKHRNLIRRSSGQVVLVDFGIARYFQSREGAGSASSGTPLFMAPEQFSKGQRLDHRADIYALGVLLYWLCSARFPAEGASLVELAAKVRAGTLTPLREHCPNIPKALELCIHRALSRTVEERHASAAQLGEELQSFLARSSRWGVGRKPWLVAALGVLCTITYFAWHTGEQSPIHAVPYQAQWESRRGKAAASSTFTPLGTAAELYIGDEVRLRLALENPGFVYVFNEDALGAIYLLWPSDSEGLTPALPAGETLLPPGDDNAWLITSDGGGRETFLILVSSKPLLELERVLGQFPRPTPEQSAEFAAVVRSALRGAGGVKWEAALAAGAPTETMAELLAKLGSDFRPLWNQIEVRNSGPPPPP